jgi:hypothetical protein
MNLFEFFYFGMYLFILTTMIVGIQQFETNQKRLSLETKQEEVEEILSEEEEPVSEDEAPVESTSEQPDEFTMTENPMFRHRNGTPLVEQVD